VHVGNTVEVRHLFFSFVPQMESYGQNKHEIQSRASGGFWGNHESKNHIKTPSGKTFIVQQFGKEEFENIIFINFERNPEYKAVFSTFVPIEIIDAS
jgi:hypothetical protein